MAARLATLSVLAATSVATASCGEPPRKSVDEQFFAARNARCEKYGRSDGYVPVDPESVRHILQASYKGERMMAHLSPEHHCAATKTVGERTCYRFFASAIDVGGGLQFCADRDGNVSNVEIGE